MKCGEVDNETDEKRAKPHFDDAKQTMGLMKSAPNLTSMNEADNETVEKRANPHFDDAKETMRLMKSAETSFR